ncbi:glycosyltransferase family 4 protein [Candidatus Woesearchaeota archaeon]|nr:glycosyltransferase family 4 protein [Candidatus Woesearchaeota archaeon]
MKIVMLHPHDIYSAKEPWTIRIVEIARQFVSMGHSVKLIYFPLPKKERGLLKSSKIKDFETIPFSRRSYHLIKNIFRFRKYAKWADLIYFQKCFPNAAMPALFGAYFFNKLVHYDWDDWEYQIYNVSSPSKLFGWYLNTIERMMPSLVDSVSVASFHLRKLALKLGARRVAMAHVGVNLERFSPSVDGSSIRKKYGLKKNVVLYLGQLNGAQYAELVIKAFPKILDKMKDTSLLIVGGGSELNRLKKLASGLENVVFTGFLPDEDIPRCISCADVAVASFEKNKVTQCKSPLKIVEYLGSGKAIVASDVGEVKRMVGDAGIIVPPGNADAISEAVVKILSDSELRKKFEKDARRQAEEKFNWGVTAQNINDNIFISAH